MNQKQLETLYKTHSHIIKLDGEIYKLNSKYKYGKVAILNNIAIIELTQNSSQKLYVDFKNLNGAYSDDMVIVQVIFNPKGKIKAKVVLIAKSSNNEILCYKKDNIIHTVKDDIQMPSLTLPINNGDVVVVQNGKVIKEFGNITDSKVDEKISLYLGKEDYRLENKKYDISSSLVEDNTRVNLTHLEFCTIDPASAKDHDDAIYFDEANNELYVAIADVSAFVKEGSALDLDAQRRGFSIYFPHKVLPMLPFELSADLCSLVPNQKRYAYVFKIKLDIKKATVLDSELFEAVIESKHKYSYEQIDEVLVTNDKSNHFVRLYDITKKYKKARLYKGYDFRSEEVRQVLDEEENLLKTKTELSTPSHSLIEECMLLANQEGAKKIKQTGIFRVHDEPTPAKITKLLDEVNMLGLRAKSKKDIHSTILSIQDKASKFGLESEIDELIIQSQQQAKYYHLKKEHFGLGFSDYSHFTSPIRRYSDLVLHRILKSTQIPKNIETLCENISTVEREITSLVWDFEDRKYARYMANNIEEVFTAKIVDTVNYVVKLDNQPKGTRVYVENYSGEKLFSQIQVKIVSSDIVSKKIIGMII